MATRTVRLDEETLQKAEIQAIKESSQKLKRVLPKEVIARAVQEYVNRVAENAEG